MNDEKLMPCYLYSRVSSKKQSTDDKDGFNRQEISDKVINFLKKHKLQLLPENKWRHVGSSFKGQNFATGTPMDKFIQRAKAKQIELGVLVIENCSRFGRDFTSNQMERMGDILKTGMKIGIVDLDMLFDFKQFNTDRITYPIVSQFVQMASIDNLERSEKVRNSLQTRIDKIKAGAKIFLGGQSPSWIKGIDENGKWILNEENIATVKNIFKQYLDGVSAYGLAQKFNQTGVRAIRAKTWNASSIRYFLASPSVVGDFSMGDCKVKHYYPSIISDTDFNIVQRKLEQNKSKRGGSQNGRIQNLFAGLTTCTCGATIIIQPVYAGGKVYRYAACKARREKSCNAPRINLYNLEETIFAFVLKQTIDELLVKPSTPNSNLEALESQLRQINGHIETTLKLIDDGCTAEQIAPKLKAYQLKKQALAKQIATEKHANALIESSPETIEKLNVLLKGSDEETDAIHFKLRDEKIRFQLRNIMPDIFSSIKVNFAKNEFTCTFANGKTQTLGVYHPG